MVDGDQAKTQEGGAGSRYVVRISEERAPGGIGGMQGRREGKSEGMSGMGVGCGCVTSGMSLGLKGNPGGGRTFDGWVALPHTRRTPSCEWLKSSSAVDLLDI